MGASHSESKDGAEQSSRVSWLQYDATSGVDSVQGKLIRGGTDSNGKELYIGRGRYKNGMHLGIYRVGSDKLTISWGGEDVTLGHFELLFGDPLSVQWIRKEGRFLSEQTDGFVPIVGGYESDNRPLYIIQGYHEGGVYCGKVREKSLGFIPYNGDEVMLNTYNTLVAYSGPHTAKKGRFVTMNDVAEWSTLKPGNTFSHSMPILSSSCFPPRIAYWLGSIDLYKADSNWRIRSFVDNLSPTGFNAHLDTWSSSILYNAGLSFMQIKAIDPDLRCGVVHHAGETTQRVSFDWYYEEPPLVFVALCGFDFGKNPRISVKADTIDCSGFKLKVGKWDDTIIHGFHVTWIAFPANSKAIQYGTFTAKDRPTVGSVTFSPAFERVPTILTGFTKLNLNNDNIRLYVDVGNVSHLGMDWKISTYV